MRQPGRSPMPETQLSQIRKSFPDPVSVMGSRKVRCVMQASMRSSQKAAGLIRDQIGFQRLTGHWVQAYDIRPMQLFSAAKECHGHANVGLRTINLMRAGSAQRRTGCHRVKTRGEPPVLRQPPPTDRPGPAGGFESVRRARNQAPVDSPPSVHRPRLNASGPEWKPDPARIS